MADAIYTYAGHNFTLVSGAYTTADKVAATLTLTSPLGSGLSNQNELPKVVALQMSDGEQTLNASFASADVVFSTDPAGNISQWDVDLGYTNSLGPIIPRSIETLGNVAHGGGTDSGQIFFLGIPVEGSILNDPGVWTLVPEPGTVTLLAVGLAAMAGSQRRKI
jgi:hypothetical protein